MRFVQFFKDLSNWLYKQDDINYKHIEYILNLLFKNMNDTENPKYQFWHFKCLSSIHKQLKITHFKNGRVEIE